MANDLASNNCILDLLGRIPETWSEFDPAQLTDGESTSLRHLTAAGLVEQKSRFRLRMIGDDVVIETTITASGEYGLVEAIDSLIAALSDDWLQKFVLWKDSKPPNTSPFHCESVSPSQWRLTQDGGQAIEDLQHGRERVVLDHVFRRWPLTFRPPVRGSGRLVTYGRMTDVPSTGAVAISNWNEGAAAFAEAFTALFEKRAAEKSSAAARTSGRNASTDQLLVEFLHERHDRYDELVRLVVEGDDTARRAFRAEFGPTAFVKSLSPTDPEEANRVKTAVQQTSTYKRRVKPVLQGKSPFDWEPPDDDWAEQIVTNMRQQAGEV
jgi:hypothetical protein